MKTTESHSAFIQSLNIKWHLLRNSLSIDVLSAIVVRILRK